MNTQHPEKVKILNDKLEVIDFLKRLKAAFDEDLGLKPDVFLEKMNIEYNRSSLIRLKDGALVTSDVEGIKTGIQAIDEMPMKSAMGRRGTGVRYASIHATSEKTMYAFDFRVPDSICLEVEDLEPILGNLKLYFKDARAWMDSNGQPRKLEPRDFWEIIGIIRHPLFREQYWMFNFSYENEKTPRPKCLESFRVLYREEPFDPLLWNYQLFKN